MTLPTPILVLHDLGDPAAGAPWRDLLERAEWPGAVLAPDLPGHGGTTAPTGGSYETGDAILAVLPLLRSLDPNLPAPVVVGIGVNGWAAQVIALAGRASALVLVDGLQGPWRSPTDSIAEGKRWLRRLADDPQATGPAPAAGLDPRTAHAVPTHGSRRLALKAATAMPVPAILLESPASPLSHDEAAEVADAFGRGATVVRVDAPSARACVRVVVSTFSGKAPEWSRA